MSNMSIRNTKAPCKGCEDRHQLCHADCVYYKEYKRELELKAERVRLNKSSYLEADDYLRKRSFPSAVLVFTTTTLQKKMTRQNSGTGWAFLIGDRGLCLKRPESCCGMPLKI